MEEIKRHLTEQLDEKNKQLDEVQEDTKVLNDKLSATERSLTQSLTELEKAKGEKKDQSIKRAKTEVVSELKSIVNTTLSPLSCSALLSSPRLSF